MSKFKKLVTAGIVLAMAFALAVPAMAYNIGEAKKDVPGYGTLYGSQNSNGGYVTSVTQNPDRAVLTIRSTMQNSAGSTLRTVTYKSDPSMLTFVGILYVPTSTYALWGAHGVQSGGTYAAQVVYTVTHVTV